MVRLATARYGGGGAGSGHYHFHHQLPWSLRLPRPLGSEVVVLGSTGYVGHLLWVTLIDPQALVGSLDWLVPLGAWNAVIAMLLVLITAQVGLNPTISVTLIAGLLPMLGIPGLSPPWIGVILLVGWALVLMSSTLTASMLNPIVLLQRITVVYWLPLERRLHAQCVPS